jgi:hypothetical protein
LYGIVSCHASIDDKEDLDQHFREEFGGVTRNILTTFCGQRNVTIAIQDPQFAECFSSISDSKSDLGCRLLTLSKMWFSDFKTLGHQSFRQ